MPKRQLSPSAPSAKRTKYLAKFNSSWKSEFKWCQASSKGPDFAINFKTMCFISIELS